MNTESLDILEKAALPLAQARAILRAMELEWDAQQQALATKAELENLRLAMHADFGGLQLTMKADMANLRSELKADMANLRLEMKADMAALRSELVRWVFTCILGQTAVLVGALYFVLTYLRK
jgi:hypothetical protein